MPCDVCDYGGVTIRCGYHPLLIGMVKEMHHAMLTGEMWGDIVCDLEMEMLALVSPAEKAAKDAAEKKRSEEALVSYHIHKQTLLNVDAKTGQLKKQILRPCKWANHPAENGYPAGCAAYTKGCCAHLHPGQPGYEEAKAGRSAAVPSLLRNVVYLSSKPAARNAVLATPVRDAW